MGRGGDPGNLRGVGDMVIMIVVMGVLGTPKKTGCLNKRRNYGFSTGD